MAEVRGAEGVCFHGHEYGGRCVRAPWTWPQQVLDRSSHAAERYSRPLGVLSTSMHFHTLTESCDESSPTAKAYSSKNNLTCTSAGGSSVTTVTTLREDRPECRGLIPSSDTVLDTSEAHSAPVRLVLGAPSLTLRLLILPQR